MINTLRSNNSTFVNVGNVTVKPLTTSLPDELKSQSVLTHPLQVAAPIVAEMTIATPVLSLSKAATLKVASPTLSTIAKGLAGGLVVPNKSLTNTILPAHNMALNVGGAVDVRLNVADVIGQQNLQPYEQLTGISQERPQIVMVTHFEPIFSYDVHTAVPSNVTNAGVNPAMTDAGNFLETQFNMRNLKAQNMTTLLSNVRSAFNDMSAQLAQRRADFSNAVKQLGTSTSFLMNVVRMLEGQKAQLDLRHDLYDVDPANQSTIQSNNFGSSQSQFNAVPGQYAGSNGVTTPPYDIVDVLTTIGYDATAARNTFSSTKVWLQLLVELRNALKFHTPQLIDIDPIQQRTDTSPATVLVPKTTFFSLATKLPPVPSVTDLINLQPSSLPQIVGQLGPTFSAIYQNVQFKDEEARLAALAHLISAEYRYSAGLALQTTQNTLSSYYGYTVANAGNLGVFDAVVGTIGNNIGDFQQQGAGSLVSVAQRTVGNVGILTFESKYIEAPAGTLTPGASYYYDSVLQTDGSSFNTNNLNSLAATLDGASNAFNVIVDNMNLLSAHYVRLSDNVATSYGTALTSASDIVASVRSSLLDAFGNTSTLLQQDMLAPVFAFAKNDLNTKALLFLYVLSRVARAFTNNVNGVSSSQQSDNTPLIDGIINQIDATLQATLVTLTQPPASAITNPQLSTAIPTDGVVEALRSSSPLADFVVSVMSGFVQQFLSYGAIVSGQTRYTGCQDTVVMMAVFDFLISMIAKYGNQSFVGAFIGATLGNPNTQQYLLMAAPVDHRNSINELSQRVQGEDDRSKQMTLAIMNALSKLNASVNRVTTYLNSPTATTQLATIGSMLNNDRTLVSMLLNQQQIMLLASFVDSIQAAALNGLSRSQPSYMPDPNAQQEVLILDDTIAPPALRNALYGYFGTGEFASARGQNKRILTVGIPQGFVQQITQKTSIIDQRKASFQNKQSDVVQVCVYKVDVLNSDIVYKPLRFLFELSRFPVRASTKPWLPLAPYPTIADIVSSIPTLNMNVSVQSTSKSVDTGLEYAPTTVMGKDPVASLRTALVSDDYSFLTANQKTQLLQDHVVSQLLDGYIKMMTGIDVAEHTFDVSPQQVTLDARFTQQLVDHATQLVTNKSSLAPVKPSTVPTGGILFSSTKGVSIAQRLGSSPISVAKPQLTNPAGVSGYTSQASQTRGVQQSSPAPQSIQQVGVVNSAALAAVSARVAPLLLETFKAISTLKTMVTDVSDVGMFNSRVVTPKKFDRVFNVIFDPSDFEVDVEKTTATPYGASALRLMVGHGEVVPVDDGYVPGHSVSFASSRAVTPGSRQFITGRPATVTNGYKRAPVSVSSGDVIIDEYFVTVETFGEGDT